jgi:hypothetical protein
MLSTAVDITNRKLLVSKYGTKEKSTPGFYPGEDRLNAALWRVYLQYFEVIF